MEISINTSINVAQFYFTRFALSLPSMIQFGDNSYIQYTYGADGQKLRTQYGVQPGLGPLTPADTGGSILAGGTAGTDAVETVPPTDELSRVDYCGNMVYDRGERRMLLENGYVTFDLQTNTPSYHFYLRDHLGNNRVVMAGDGTVEQVAHYYPFGGVMRESTNPGLQPYKYGGKELDRTSGLDAYDFGARMYFADRLQWGQMDPLCEKYYDVSPYGYCHNNPIIMFDIDGKNDYWLTDSGHILLGAKNDSPYHTIYAENGSSINVSKSFLDNRHETSAIGQSSNKKRLNYTITIYSADKDNGKGIFEFFTNNTKVEWSIVTLSSSEGITELIGTSNSEGDDMSMSYMVDTASPEQIVVEATHSHSFDNGLPSPGDINVAHNINSKYPSATLFIFDRLGYNQYDEFSSTQLEIIVYPSSKEKNQFK